MPPGLQAPDPSFLPAGTGETAAAVERFRCALRRVAEHTGEFHAHPALGRATPEQWLWVHDRWRTRQARGPSP